MRINQILKIQLLLTLGLLGNLAQAADIQNGKALHQAKCYQCHAEKSGLGNGDVIYTRLDRKAKDLAKVKSMVAMCNTELRLDLFPEDEADLVAYINQQFYKYK
jgi:mono/diheme cytochrome c family protein